MHLLRPGLVVNRCFSFTTGERAGS